jgi:M6 family metalloprotease-like protein
MLSSPLQGGDLGFPRDPENIPTLGTHRAVAIFVDFNDVKGDAKLFDEWRLHQIPTMEKTFSTMSYGQLTYTIEIVPEIFHINRDSIYYLMNTPHDAPQTVGAPGGGALVMDAIAVADPKVDFSQFEFINVITPNSPNFLFSGATGIRTVVDGKRMTRATFGAEDEYIDNPQKANWLVHETGHLMGLIHNYDISGQSRLYRSNGFGLPAYDAMTYPLTVALDFFGWSKFLLGWLSESQVQCLSLPLVDSSTHLITPIGVADDGVKIVALRLSDVKVLVIESRRRSSLDQLLPAEEGLVVYTVDMTVKSGGGAIVPVFNKARVRQVKGDLKFGADATFDAGFTNLVPGEVLQNNGVEIKYLKKSDSGDYFSVRTIN